MTGKVEVRLVRSYSGRPETQRRTLQALGLRKLNQAVVHNDSPGLRGQIAKVQHLVQVAPVQG